MPQDVAHGLGCLILLLPGGVGVGAQGEPGVKVPQHGGHRFYIYAILQGRGGEGVPQIVEPEMPSPASFKIFLWRFTTLSGGYISPVRGERNR